jgi:hypothetical protein
VRFPRHVQSGDRVIPAFDSLVVGFPKVVAAQEVSPALNTGLSPSLQPVDLVRMKISHEPDLSGDYRLAEHEWPSSPRLVH